MTDREQLMTKLRLRRLLEAMLDADLVQVDVEEDDESASNPRDLPVHRVSLIVRYIPA